MRNIAILFVKRGDDLETRGNSEIYNSVEIDCITDIVSGLVTVRDTLLVLVHHVSSQHGVAPGNITLITPYKRQQKLLQQQVLKFMICPGSQKEHHTEVLTIDQCQGRDNECIVLSLVRSNSDRQVCVCMYVCVMYIL